MQDCKLVTFRMFPFPIYSLLELSEHSLVSIVFFSDRGHAGWNKVGLCANCVRTLALWIMHLWICSKLVGPEGSVPGSILGSTRSPEHFWDWLLSLASCSSKLLPAPKYSPYRHMEFSDKTLFILYSNLVGQGWQNRGYVDGNIYGLTKGQPSCPQVTVLLFIFLKKNFHK